jgi:hypothetical protein
MVLLHDLLDDSRIGWIPESNGYPAVPSSVRPSAVHSVKYFTVKQITTPSESSGNSISQPGGFTAFSGNTEPFAKGSSNAR